MYLGFRLPMRGLRSRPRASWRYGTEMLCKEEMLARHSPFGHACGRSITGGGQDLAPRAREGSGESLRTSRLSHKARLSPKAHPSRGESLAPPGQGNARHAANAPLDCPGQSTCGPIAGGCIADELTGIFPRIRQICPSKKSARSGQTT